MADRPPGTTSSVAATAVGWRVWADTGGTFTDCVAVDPAGRTHRAKVLSNSSLRGVCRARAGRRRLEVEFPWTLPEGFLVGCTFRALAGRGRRSKVIGWERASGIVELEDDPGELAVGTAIEIGFAEEAPIVAARLVTGTPAARRLPPLAMRLATTRGTNALLERRGAVLALFITRGFGDLLRIGTQQRPDLFALDIRRPQPLHAAVVEVDERLAADGSVLRQIDLQGAGRRARELAAEGMRVAAIALAHSYRNPEHERRPATTLERSGFDHVARSSELAPVAGLLPRAETAVVDAYLSPTIDDYLAAVGAALEGGSLHIMTSAGGLVRAADYRARDSLLSGPAGGVVGAARAGRQVGRERVIAFDMGGTSTDAARIDGDFEYLFETRLGDARILAPALAIESVAAGGGSICSYAGGRLRVGPESSGAHPGPACYGVGGPLSLTDVNLLLGRLDPARFEIPIDRGASERAARRLLEEVGDERGERELEALLEGLLQIADERMADAIRTISVRRGYDPRDYTLVAFGGAGGQHACAVAELLGMEEVLIPADASLLSAHGLGGARIERFAQRQVLAPLDEVGMLLPAWFDELSREAGEAVRREGIASRQVEVRRRSLALRLAGQDTAVEVPYRPGRSVELDFFRAYERIYGYGPGGRRVEVESLRVVASSKEAREDPGPEGVGRRRAEPGGEADVRLGGEWRRIPWFERRSLAAGDHLPGPALVFERHSSTTVPIGWRLRVERGGALLVTGERRRGALAAAGEEDA